MSPEDHTTNSDDFFSTNTSHTLVCVVRLHVRFGEGGSGVVSVVRYYNSTHVRCLAPPQLYPGSVVVQVSNNGFARSADFSRGGLLFTYNTPIRHLRFVPKTGSVNGGDDVLVFGKPVL